ncbi:MAG: hypothetical protein GY853_09805 [PVC group bacterium]|nr:hypothetical protein [PVC group bacterium]
MAKSILIEYVVIGGSSQKYKITRGGSEILEFPLTDDVNLEITSEFASFTEQVPLIEQLINLVTITSSFGGSISEGGLNFQNLSNVQRWQRTNPIRINLNLLLYTKESAKSDVYDPMMNLISLTVLTKDPDNPSRYRVPGLNLSNLKNSTKGGQKKEELAGRSKLISIRIPGIIYLPIALVTKAIPTVSKEETDSGYPLWASMNVEITGLYPATDDLLKLESTTFGFGTGLVNKSTLNEFDIGV